MNPTKSVMNGSEETYAGSGPHRAINEIRCFTGVTSLSKETFFEVKNTNYQRIEKAK